MTAGTLTSKGEASGPTTRVVLVIVGGLALGVLTQFGQGWFHGSWNTIANSGAVWLLGAFAVGTLMASDRWAAVAGAGTLVGAVIGYYVTVKLRLDAGYATGPFWLAFENQDAVEVRHQGELLGALTVTMPPADPMNPAKRSSCAISPGRPGWFCGTSA